MGAGSRAALTRAAPAPPGRLVALAAMGAAAGSAPLPWLPERALRRVRGAVAHDAASRHGVSLTPGARDALAEPGVRGHGDRIARSTIGWVGRVVLRRIGPTAFVAPLVAWIETWALGVLLDRYFDRSGPRRAVRMEEVEARRVRDAIDRALLRAIWRRFDGPPADPIEQPADDLRDPPTRIVDTILIGAASAPAWLRGRIEHAFDEAIGAAGEAPVA